MSVWFKRKYGLHAYFERTAAQDLKFSSYIFPAACQPYFLSSTTWCKLRLQNIKHSVHIFQFIHITLSLFQRYSFLFIIIGPKSIDTSSFVILIFSSLSTEICSSVSMKWYGPIEPVTAIQLPTCDVHSHCRLFHNEILWSLLQSIPY